MSYLTRRRRDRCEPLLWPGDEPFRLFTEGDELYTAMLAAIDRAEREVALESYIFADDEVGRQFAEALAERARAGVRVSVHLDAAGSLFWASRGLDRLLRQSGIRLRWFHRWHWTRPLRYNQRNHRKLLVVDRRQAYLGGFNIHRENSRRYYGERRWRDTHVAMTGALARQAHAAFRALWQGRPYHPDPASERPSAVVLPNKSADCPHRLHCVFAAMFGSARQRIDLTTPYFVPDAWTQQALADAAARGVAVRLLVPHQSDIAPVRWIARRIYTRLQRQGIQVFGYRSRLLHAKTLAVDGDWASVGTANLDYRSLFLNHELNLCARSPTLAAALERQFETDLADAEAFDIAARPHRPIGDRLLTPLAWAARRWL
ncbi:phospholipase D/transphosphatidylase [Salinisphaera sp. PC39]|uniref:phospholipase D-like domain-containing protein n=1 Tax=Salinisphaera sp. PC39 TaxID=1304156 RepID=UPI00333E25BD